MNVSRRRYMGAKGGSPSYQRIEYLATTSDGGQGIDTGIVPDNSVIRAEAKVRIGITSQSNGLLELWTERERYYLFDLATSTILAANFSGSWTDTKVVTRTNTDTANFHTIISTIGNGGIILSLDGSAATKNVAEGISTSDTLGLFYRKIEGGSSVSYAAKSIYLKYLKIYKNDTLVLDFIPVRIGQVGYLCDTVSGELFGNLGTGNFILGPDIGGTDYERQYLTFEALEAGTFKIGVATEYSLDDGSTWTTLAASTETPTIQAGEKILWRRTNTADVYTAFVATGNFNVYGNVMSLLYGYNFENKVTITASNALNGLFKNNTKIINAENLILPATSVPASGYQGMFSGCTNLIAAPKVLPNASASQYSYAQMFYGCTKLEASPTVLVQTLTKNMFRETFRGCSKLKWIKHMATSIATDSCYNWVLDAPSGGTFVKDANTTWPSGNSGIHYGWTVVNE